MHRIGIALVAALALAGCSAAPASPPEPPAPSVTVTAAPDGGVLLSDLGYQNGPQGFSVPNGTEITDRIDSYNNVTLIFTAPSGEDVAQYLRANLTTMGFEITADDNGSMLFTNGHWQGALTSTGGLAAVSLRTDREVTG
ncbi:MAG: hypothetical protein Q4G35_05635 [Propionibacteriaceae bacterium]|nr:hypothetical protein [Propionibacteriaceae bacterium]